MKINTITLTTGELQDALRDYCEKHAKSQPEGVHVESHNKSRIYVDLTPGGFIEASDFRHKITGGDF